MLPLMLFGWFYPLLILPPQYPLTVYMIVLLSFAIHWLLLPTPSMVLDANWLLLLLLPTPSVTPPTPVGCCYP